MRDGNAPAESSIGSGLKEIVLLTGVAVLVQAAVLYFVFPGYYRPAWPSHSDQYLAAALAHSNLRLGDYLTTPRPMGFIFLGAIGHLGIRGSMLGVTVVVLLNCALTATLFRRVVGMAMGRGFLTAFAVYVFLVFSHPFFHVYSVYDAFSQLSYLFLLTGAGLLLLDRDGGRPAFVATSGVLAWLGFLAKETYGLSALWLAAAWLVASNRRRASRAGAATIGVGLALAGALLFEWLSGSLFTGGGKGLGDPYTIVVTPVQLMKEWGRYAGAGLNQMSGIGLGLVGLAAARFLPGLGSRKWLGLVMPAAGALAWLPNAALPNHYSPGYSWNGTNLMFAPVLLLPFLWKVGRWARACSIIVSVLILGSPALSGGAYKDNAWALEQEARQRNVLTVLQGLMERLPSETDSYRVLVTGIDFVFSPFDHGLSMRSFPHGRITEFEVLAYTPRVPGVSPVPRLELNSGVTFISPREITFSRYSRVWAFRSDGTLAKEARDPSGLANRPHDESELSLEELLIFPNLLGILGDPSHPDPARKPPDGYTYLACGTALLNYQEAAGAEKCLAQSAKLIPNNPYPYFYLGLIREKRGLTESARVLLEKAIDLDDPKSPNAWFRTALRQLGDATPRR